MGYLANIIQDARRQSGVGTFASLPLVESHQSELVLTDADAAEMDVPSSIPTAVSPQDVDVRPPLESPAASVRGKANRRNPGPAPCPPSDQARQPEVCQLPPLQEVEEGLLPTGDDDHGRPRGDSPVRSPLAEDVPMAASPSAPIGSLEKAQRAPGPRSQPPSRVLAGDSPLANSKTSRSASRDMEAAGHNEIPAEDSGAATTLAPFPVDPTTSAYEDSAKATVQTPILPLLNAARRERNSEKDGGALHPSAVREAQQSPPGTTEERVWSQDITATGVTQTRAVEPQVHIGRIEVVIQAPESSRHNSPQVSPAGGLVNRQYLRRL